MRDLVMVATVVAFFALAVLYVRACDRIVGPDDPGDLADGVGVDAAPVVEETTSR
jgi:hypothetical protein